MHRRRSTMSPVVMNVPASAGTVGAAGTIDVIGVAVGRVISVVGGAMGAVMAGMVATRVMAGVSVLGDEVGVGRCGRVREWGVICPSLRKG